MDVFQSMAFGIMLIGIMLGQFWLLLTGFGVCACLEMADSVRIVLAFEILLSSTSSGADRNAARQVLAECFRGGYEQELDATLEALGVKHFMAATRNALGFTRILTAILNALGITRIMTAILKALGFTSRI